jgi:dTDP-4-dehydrorhamnose reductase
MKILITGADGALGTALQTVLRRENIQTIATDIKQMDVADFKKTNDTLLHHRPDAIIHCAAISNVDECEKNKDLALRVNALGTLGLATISRKINAKFLYLSTNFIFDGTREEHYDEYAQPNPLNEYGRTKLLGERYVKDACERYFIVRTSWLFGERSKTFISRFLQEKTKPASISVICDQFASFTYTLDLAEVLTQIIKSDHYGIYHCANAGCGSWLDFALKAKDIMHFSTALNPVKTEELKLPAPRPRYAPLESNTYPFLFNRSIRSWEEALAVYAKSIL